MDASLNRNIMSIRSSTVVISLTEFYGLTPICELSTTIVPRRTEGKFVVIFVIISLNPLKCCLKYDVSRLL